MIIVMKPNASQDNIGLVLKYIEEKGLQTHLSKGEETTIIGVVGDKTKLGIENLVIFKDVDKLLTCPLYSY